MTARKRKSPDRKKNARREPGLLPRLLAGTARAAARHPKPLFAGGVFCVIFSFVAANALWYQPGGHPAPFLATRDSHDPNRIAGYRPMRRTAPDDVTTFRIERAVPDAVPAATPVVSPNPVAAPLPVSAPMAPPAPRPQLSQPVPQQPAPVSKPAPAETAKAAPAVQARTPQPMPPKPLPAGRPVENVSAHGDDPVAAAIRAADRKPSMTPPAEIPNATGSNPGRTATQAAQRPSAALPPASGQASAAQASSMVLQIQRGLSNIAYADVEVDGFAGSQTKAAIRRFQKHYRLPETGEPDEMVLKKLKSIGAL